MEDLLAEHGYPGLFLAVLVFGFPVLLPALYLAAKGSLSVAALLLLHLAAALTSDAFWYGTGRIVPVERMSRWRFLERTRPLFVRLERLSPRALLRFLFAARFLYGAKLSTNVVSGALRLDFLPFVLVNALSTALLFGILLLISYTAGEAYFELMGRQSRVQGVLWSLLAVGIALNLLLRRFTRVRLARVRPARQEPPERAEV